MKKILATILAAAAFLPALADGESSADVLVWYVDTANAWGGGKNTKFDEIKFWAVDANDMDNKIGLGGVTYDDPADLLAVKYSDLSREGTAASYTAFNGPTTAAGTYYTDIRGLDNGYAFLMELYNDGKLVDWMVQSVSLQTLQEASGIYNIQGMGDLNMIAGMDGYDFGAKMAPEPTSGLLLLVGGALLALRRRRMA